MAGPSSTNMDPDTKRAQEIYNGFCTFLQISTVATIITLALMAIFLV